MSVVSRPLYPRRSGSGPRAVRGGAAGGRRAHPCGRQGDAPLEGLGPLWTPGGKKK